MDKRKVINTPFLCFASLDSNQDHGQTVQAVSQINFSATWYRTIDNKHLANHIRNGGKLKLFRSGLHDGVCVLCV